MAKQQRNQGSTNPEGIKWGKVKETRLAETVKEIETSGRAAEESFRAFASAKDTASQAKAFRTAVDAAVTYREAVAEKEDLEKSIAHDKLMAEVRGLSNGDLEALIERVKAEAQKAAGNAAQRSEEHRTQHANPEVKR